MSADDTGAAPGARTTGARTTGATTGARATGAMRRRGRSVSTAALGTLLVLGATAGAVLADSMLDRPGQQQAGAKAPVVTLDPVEVSLACSAGPAALMGPGAVVDPAAPPQDLAPTVTRAVGSLPTDRTEAAPATLDGTPLPSVGPLALGGDGGGEVGVLSAAPRDGRTALLAGSTVSVTATGDLRGLFAVPCVLPESGAWLVGGSTEVGTSTALHLHNLGATPTAVTISALGSLGELAAPSLQRVTVAPGQGTTVLLEGAVAPDASPAVHIESDGGAVAAWGQTLALDGVVPAGISGLSPAAEPAADLLVPGVLSSGQDAGVLRVVNPGSAEAHVRVDGLGDVLADGGGRTPVGELIVAPGAVAELPLGDVPQALAVTSDAPVTAAAGLRLRGTPSLLDPDTAPVETAWAPAVAPRTTGVWVLPTAPEGRAARLVLAARAGEGGLVTVRIHRGPQAEAEERVVDLAPGSGAGVDLGDASAVVVRSEVPVAASVLLTQEAADGRFVEVLPATPDPHAEQSLRVDVR